MKASTSAPKNEAGSLTKIAYDLIKADIMRHEIKPGQRLSGSSLAKKLNMSRTPVREALNLLENEGFVEIRNGVGIHIKEITKKDIIELIEVRVALECAALESAAFKVDGAALQALEEGWQNLRDQYRSGRLDELDKVMALDYRTHDFIVASSNNTYLIEVIKNVSDRFRRVQDLSVMALGDVEDTIDQHLELLRGLKDGRLKEVLKTLKRHILEARTYIFTDPPEKVRQQSA